MRLSCQAFNICCAVQPGKGKSEAVEGVTPNFPCSPSLTYCYWENEDNLAFFTDLKQIFHSLIWGGGCIALHMSL